MRYPLSHLAPRRVFSLVTATILSITTMSGAVAAQGTERTAVPSAPLGRVNTWVPTGEMARIRSGSTATLLLDGDVLVAGGGTATAELYDPKAGRFAPAGTMTTPRTDATATRLADGDVLVAGGWVGNRQTASVDLYSSATGTWSSTTPMQVARSGQTATLLADGRVLVTGGGCNGGVNCDAGSSLENLRSAEVYDPGTATWTLVANMKVGRQFATATLLADGRVLVTGGFANCDDDFCKDTASTQIFDPTTETWTSTGALKKPRQQHTATLLPDGRVLVAGGTIVNGDMGRNSTLAEAEVYDPTTGDWSTVPSMPDRRTDSNAVLLNNGWVLVSGGGTAAASIYQPQFDRWVPTSSMHSSRSDGTATGLSDGDVLVTGGGVNTAEIYRFGVGPLVALAPRSVRFGSVLVGASSPTRHFTLTNEGDGPLHVDGIAVAGADQSDFTATNDCPRAVAPEGSCGVNVVFGPTETGIRSASIDVIDNGPGGGQSVPVSGYGKGNTSWAPTGSLVTGRENYAMVRIPGYGVLVAGGRTGALQDLNTAEIYHPVTERFTATGSMPVAVSFVTATLLKDERVLVAGGLNNFHGTPVTQLYDPATGTWSVGAQMNASGDALTSTLLDDGSVLVTGLGGGRLAEVYHPRTDRWTDTKTMVGDGMYSTATRLEDGRVLVAGGGVVQAGIYNPARNSWTAATSMNIARQAPQAALLPDGTVLVAGGASSQGYALDTAEIFHPSTDSWTFTQNKMFFGQDYFAMTMMANGNVLAAGGCTGIGCDSLPLSSTEIYDTQAQFWEPNPDMVTPRANEQLAVLPSGAILTVGGTTKCCAALRAAEIYTPILMRDRPSSGPIGTNVVVTGTGYDAFEKVHVEWNFAPWLTLTAGAKGRFTAHLKIPGGSPGVNVISTFARKSGTSARCVFTITQARRE